MAEPVGPNRGRDAMEIGIEIHVFLHRQVLIQTKLLRHIPQLTLHPLRFPDHIEADHPETAGSRRHQPADQPQQRRLPGAIRPDEGGQLPLAQGQVQCIDCRHAAAAFDCKYLGQPCRLNGQPLLTHKLPHTSSRTVAGMPRRSTLSVSST